MSFVARAVRIQLASCDEPLGNRWYYVLDCVSREKGASLAPWWASPSSRFSWYLSSSRVHTFFMPTARNTSALLTFFVVTYLVTWGSWLAASSIAAGAPRQLLFFLGVFAPGSAALWPRFGSLLPVMLMHAAVNNTKDIVPSAEPNATNPWAPSHSLVAWLSVALLSLCAGYFLLRMRKNPQLAREVAHSVAT